MNFRLTAVIAGITTLFALSADVSIAQIALPNIVVTAPPQEAAARRPKKKRPSIVQTPVRASPTRTVARNPTPRSRIVAPTPPAAATAGANNGAGAETAAQQGAASFDRVRQNIFPRAGANAYDIGRAAIEATPQGGNQSLTKVLLQAPGITQDSAASGDLHIRNEHSNIQYRINGIMLPDGISGFGQFLETSFVGNLALLTGALPAQYGLRTSGVVDITARSGAFDNGGSASVYGGSRGTITNAVEYGGHAGAWDYFFTGRYMANKQGLENPAPTFNPIHDQTQQGRYFAYATNKIDDSTRMTIISGAYSGKFQIPNNPGQLPSFTAFGISNFDSSRLNENQNEKNVFNVVALQKSIGALDFQVAAFSRYSSLHFVPDLVGDMVFNGTASDVYRSSFNNGIQADGSYRFSAVSALRFGFIASAERTRIVNSSALLPLDGNGDPVDAPFGVVDRSSKTGWTLGAYAQHEWKIADRLTLNTGLRFDQNWSYVEKDQVSPRASLVWKPFDGTTVHAGYARYFTPPRQAVSAPTNLALYANTTQAPEIPISGAVRPERSHYFDVGVTQKLFPGFEVGVGAYYKRARNLLDDGQFGQALVLSAFNYDRAYNVGVEMKAAYTTDNVRIYGNLAWARQRATQVISNQFLFGADEFTYISGNYVYTDHAQTWTGSAGASWQIIKGSRISADMIYGSGLRSGFANTAHVSPYTQVNVGFSQEVQFPGLKPTTFRIDVVNLLDHTYAIRDGSGIGVFAPQYGPRRGIYAGLSQKF